jgi:uncharacterized damage-inducible protein DinB
MTETTNTTETGEKAELLERLDRQRQFLRHTTRDLTDEQAARRTCASELCLGGIVKHVTRMERRWAGFLSEGPAAMEQNENSQAEHAASFRMEDGDTLAGLLADYEQAARETSEVVAALPAMDESQELPPAPWFPPGARWSHRQVLIHVICETAQHSGHADIVRESLDGAKTMG